MKDTEIIKAIAELDGFAGWWCESCHSEVPPSQVSYEETHSDPYECGGKCGSKPYLTSRDAIIPVIEKKYSELGQDFAVTLSEHLMQPLNDDGMFNLHGWFGFLLTTPRQLCEALLRATNKWKD